MIEQADAAKWTRSKCVNERESIYAEARDARDRPAANVALTAIEKLSGHEMARLRIEGTVKVEHSMKEQRDAALTVALAEPVQLEPGVELFEPIDPKTEQ